MELLYIAITVKVLATVDPTGMPEVKAYPNRFTTREDCLQWQSDMSSLPFDEIDPATGAKIMMVSYECTPYRPDDILEDIERFRD